MRQGLPEFLARPRSLETVISGRKCRIKLMSSDELLSARVDGEGLYRACPELGRALCGNAALTAGSVFRRGKRLFGSAGEAVKKLSPWEIESAARRYAELAGGEDWDWMAEAMRGEPFERLKWLVLKSFGVLPTEKRAAGMADRDYIFCALNLWLDSAGQAGGGAENPAFDRELFESLKGAGS